MQYIYSLGTQMAAENGLTIICYPFDGPTVSPRFFLELFILGIIRTEPVLICVDGHRLSMAMVATREAKEVLRLGWLSR